MIGRTISHYRIEAEMGRGGMGVVYRARDERLQRSVALKLLPTEIAGHAQRRERTLAEARAAAALNHPGIMTIYEVGEEGDQAFIVMEMVAGKTLRALISEGPVEPRMLARLGAQVAEALAAAHAQGVIHGDIKPENVVVQADARVKLLDFGIARQVAMETATATRLASPPGGCRIRRFRARSLIWRRRFFAASPATPAPICFRSASFSTSLLPATARSPGRRRLR